MTTGRDRGGPARKSRQTRLPIVEAQRPSLPITPAASRIIDELSQAGAPTGFVGPAETRLAAAVDKYTEVIGVAAVQRARALGSTVVDAPHIDWAVDVDRSGGEARQTALRKAQLESWLLGTAGLTGGIASGTSVTLLLASAPPDRVWAWWTAVICLALLSAVALAKTYPRRVRRTDTNN